MRSFVLLILSLRPALAAEAVVRRAFMHESLSASSEMREACSEETVLDGKLLLLCDNEMAPIRDAFGASRTALLGAIAQDDFQTLRKAGRRGEEPIAGTDYVLRPIREQQYKQLRVRGGSGSRKGVKLLVRYQEHLLRNKDSGSLMEKIVMLLKAPKQPTDRNLWVVVSRLPAALADMDRKLAVAFELFGAPAESRKRVDYKAKSEEDLQDLRLSPQLDVFRMLSNDLAFMQKRDLLDYHLFVQTRAVDVDLCGRVGEPGSCVNPFCFPGKGWCVDLHAAAREATDDAKDLVAIGEFACQERPSNCDLRAELTNSQRSVQLRLTCFSIRHFLSEDSGGLLRESSTKYGERLKGYVAQHFVVDPTLLPFAPTPVLSDTYPAELWDGIGTCHAVPRADAQTTPRLWVAAPVGAWDLGGEYRALPQMWGGGHVFQQVNSGGTSPGVAYREKSGRWALARFDTLVVQVKRNWLDKSAPRFRSSAEQKGVLMPDTSEWEGVGESEGQTIFTTTSRAAYLTARRTLDEEGPSTMYVQGRDGAQLFRRQSFLERTVRGFPVWRKDDQWLFADVNEQWAFGSGAQMAEPSGDRTARSVSLGGGWPDECKWSGSTKAVDVWQVENGGFPVIRAGVERPLFTPPVELLLPDKY